MANGYRDLELFAGGLGSLGQNVGQYLAERRKMEKEAQQRAAIGKYLTDLAPMAQLPQGEIAAARPTGPQGQRGVAAVDPNAPPPIDPAWKQYSTNVGLLSGMGLAPQDLLAAGQKEYEKNIPKAETVGSGTTGYQNVRRDQMGNVIDVSQIAPGSGDTGGYSMGDAVRDLLTSQDPAKQQQGKDALTLYMQQSALQSGARAEAAQGVMAGFEKNREARKQVEALHATRNTAGSEITKLSTRLAELTAALPKMLPSNRSKVETEIAKVRGDLAKARDELKKATDQLKQRGINVEE